jgi:uncharacterized protein YfaS (alpha-2-macroglobulin family)
MKVVYKNTEGRVIDISKLKQTTDIRAEVSIQHPGGRDSYKNMALTFVVPSGWEIRNDRLHNMNSSYAIDNPDYTDIRDDRVKVYFDIPSNSTKTFAFMFNASYTGRFFKPAVYCEAMYDNEISAIIPGNWVVVEK